MRGWFTAEQIEEDSWCISEYSRWEETHCDLLEERERALLIDTRLDVDSIRTQVKKLTNRLIEVLTIHAH